MKKICVICGKEFETNYKQVVTCSKECLEIRKKRCVKKYYQDNRDKLLEYQAKYQKEHRKSLKPEKKNTVQAEFDHTIKAKEDDPRWIKDYAKADRLTKISMLARQMSDLGIKKISYGELSTFWNTLKYLDWEHMVLGILRSKEKRNEFNT